MKKIFLLALLTLMILPLGCAQYRHNYDSYTAAWAKLAENQGNLFKIGVAADGKIQSIEMGNFAVAMAMATGFQKPTSEGVEILKSFFSMAPYAAMFGLGAYGIQHAGHNTTTNTTTTTTNTGDGFIATGGTDIGNTPILMLSPGP